MMHIFIHIDVNVQYACRLLINKSWIDQIWMWYVWNPLPWQIWTSPVISDTMALDFLANFFFKQQNKRNDCWPVKVLVSPIGVEGLF